MVHIFFPQDTTRTYDGLNNLTRLQRPDTGASGYTYDVAGNRGPLQHCRLTKISDSSGSTTCRYAIVAATR